jgi:hypothetical protein
LKHEGHVLEGDVFVSIGSMPIHSRERANMMKINMVK